MAKFAPVAPIQVLEQLYDHNPEVFGEYHLLLAHHTVEHQERFSDLFSRIFHDGIIRPTIIMDNSVVETGGYVNFEMMCNAVNAVHPEYHEVIPVLPDVMGNGQRTREAVLEAYTHWEHNIPCAGFMAVCQGENLDDFMESLDLFADRTRFPMIDYLGIPRFLVGLIGTRKEAILEAHKTVGMTQHKIHLLGYSDDMIDDKDCSQHFAIYGIDSAVPLRVEGQFKWHMDAGKRPEDWFERAQLGPQMLANLGYVRQCHRGDFI